MSDIKKKVIVRTLVIIISILMLFSAYEIHKQTEQRTQQRRIGIVKVISYNPNTEEAEVIEEIYGTIQTVESEEGLQIYVFTE